MTKIKPFEQVSYLTQIRRLRALAIEAACAFPVKIKKIDFIRYGANAIFKVTDTSHKKYLLRIHPADYNTRAAILEEFKWVNHLFKTTDIPVATPIHTRQGSYLMLQAQAGIMEPRYCDMLTWLDGKFLWKSINEKYAYNLGVLMGRLQRSGKEIAIKHRYYWDAGSLVGTDKARCGNIENLSGISKAQQKILTDARCCAYEKLTEYEKAYPDKSGLIHGDLNPNNIIITHQHYGAIDFDDCGIGLYGIDLATPLLAFEHLAEDQGKNFNALKDALLLGYSEHMPLAQTDIDMIPYFLLALKLHSVAWLNLKKDNARLRPWFLKAVQRAIIFFEQNHRISKIFQRKT